MKTTRHTVEAIGPPLRYGCVEKTVMCISLMLVASWGLVGSPLGSKIGFLYPTQAFAGLVLGAILGTATGLAGLIMLMCRRRGWLFRLAVILSLLVSIWCWYSVAAVRYGMP